MASGKSKRARFLITAPESDMVRYADDLNHDPSLHFDVAIFVISDDPVICIRDPADNLALRHPYQPRRWLLSSSSWEY